MKMKRVFLKLSGEALAGPKKTGFDEDTVKEVARQVKLSVDAGVQVGADIALLRNKSKKQGEKKSFQAAL